MDSISWRVPTAGDPRLLRLGLAQVGLASIVAGLVLAATLPSEWLAPALAGLVPLAVYMAYRRWRRYQQSMLGSDNVRIDESGLHWQDAAGQEQTFSRGQVSGFAIARDRDTLRPVAALTLHLAGHFESQPIELHPPATPEAVRDLLTRSWKIAEREPDDNLQRGSYDCSVQVYSECHDEFQEWHWEGTRDELSRFFGLIANAADELPLPPPGAKPARRIFLANRREPTRLSIAHAPQPHFDHDTIAAPADTLRTIANRAVVALRDSVEVVDAKFDVLLGTGNVWTFHLHVRAL